MNELITDVMRPIESVELRRDLWPDMRQRLDRQTMRVSAFDWALIAVVIVSIALFPQQVLTILYHL